MTDQNLVKLTNRGYTINKKIFFNKLDKFRKDLTVHPEIANAYSGLPTVSFMVYKENTNKMYLPRFYGLTKIGAPDIIEINVGKAYPKMKFIGELREYQKIIVEEANTQLDKTGGCVIVMPCGLGKTSVALFLAAYRKIKTYVIVHKESLLKQWKERINYFLPGIEVGTIRGNIIDNDKPIVICMLQSISQKNYSQDIFNNVGLVIVDECHHISAEIFSRALPKIAARYMIGLSATPFRKDGLTKVFIWYLGEIIRLPNEILEKIEIKGVIVKRIIFESKNLQEVYDKIGNISVPLSINKIIKCETRNALLLSELIKLINQGRHILFLSERIKHLRIIKSMVDEMAIPNCITCFYIGKSGKNGMTDEDYKKAEYASLIFGTMQMAQEGLDLPHLNTLILATPKSDIEQAVGRILRKESEICLFIVDIA
jgi:superfamily II DNA or RNA helicase